LTNLVEAFETSGADTLGRPQPLRAEQPVKFQDAVADARTSWLGHNPDSAIYSDVAGFVPADNVAVAYRRDVFDLLGLFDESFDACEDVEFNTRVRQVGLTCYFTPTIAVEYQPRSTLRGLVYQMARYGHGRARLARKNPASITLPSVVPSLWLMWLMVGSVASLFVVALSWVFAASVAAYSLAVLAESLRLSLRNRTSIWRLPLVFAAIHVGYGWGFLREALATWPGRGLQILHIPRVAARR
jgi:succinoglycan biosynthesis protein ExoA